jgi:ADP-heptose:LPS heptosyltransferase
VAAAVGIPAVAVFGPTDPAVWGPRGPRVRIVTARERTPESLAEVTADEVFRALCALAAGGPAHLQR